MEREETNMLLQFDKEHIWHPYTSMIEPLPVYMVERAEGVYIELSDGRKLIDGMSSWWCAVHGYNNKKLNSAVENQLKSMSHVMFGGLTHKPAVELAQRLVEMTPKGLNRIFYSDSGSVSVEVAVKMALQYMQARGDVERTKLATIRGGYHGDTWHAMSVCDPEGGMHSLYHGRLPIQYFVDQPQIAFHQQWCDSDIEPMEKLLREKHKELAAVIVESIVQGAGGMWFYHPNYLKRLRELCDRYDLLLIADEIATGFGRTGKMFACDWAEISPDIMCVGKAITGGYMSFAATIATDKVAMTISENPPHSFMHGPTFMGNPLACAVANCSLEMLSDPALLERIAQIESGLQKGLEPIKGLKGVSDVRVLGAIGVVELEEPVDMAYMQKMCVELGVWIRPFGKLFYVMPQYIITDEQLSELCAAMVTIVKKM